MWKWKYDTVVKDNNVVINKLKFVSQDFQSDNKNHAVFCLCVNEIKLNQILLKCLLFAAR